MLQINTDPPIGPESQKPQQQLNFRRHLLPAPPPRLPPLWTKSLCLCSIHSVFGRKPVCHYSQSVCHYPSLLLFPHQEVGKCPSWGHQLPSFGNVNLEWMDLRLPGVRSLDWGAWKDCPFVPDISIPELSRHVSFLSEKGSYFSGVPDIYIPELSRHVSRCLVLFVPMHSFFVF